MRIVSRLSLLLLVLMFCLPAPAQANVGLPMVVPMGILMIGALLPIIGIEAWVLSVRLNVGFWTALVASGAANAVSTIVALPVACLAGGAFGEKLRNFLPKSNAAWKQFLDVILSSLIGLRTERNVDWIIPSAELVLLVPLFFVSWWIESFVVSWNLEVSRTDRISGAVFVANLFSYGFLALVPTLFLIRSRKTLLTAIHTAREIRTIYKGFTPDGRRMTADQYGTIRFFDALTGEQTEVLDPVRAEVVCEAVSLDGRFSVGHDRRGHAIWENAIKKEICRLEDDDYFDAVTFSPDAQYLAAVAESVPGVRLWNCQTGRLLLAADVDSGYSIAFSPDGRIVSVDGREIFIHRTGSWKLSPALEQVNMPNLDRECDVPSH